MLLQHAIIFLYLLGVQSKRLGLDHLLHALRMILRWVFVVFLLTYVFLTWVLTNLNPKSKSAHARCFGRIFSSKIWKMRFRCSRARAHPKKGQ